MEQAIVIDTPEGIRLYQLAAARGAIRLEKIGLKHSSGRSVRKHWAQILGLKATAKADVVIAKIQDEINKIMADRGA